MTGHPFLTGIGIGMAAGAAVGAVMMKNEKTITRKAGKVIRSMGDLVEDAADDLARRLPH